VNPADKALDAIIGRVLRGEYKKRGQRLTDLAELAGIPYVTLQKKINGKSSLTAVELIALCKAMDPTLDPGAVLDEAQRFFESMSPAPHTTDDINQKRREKEAEARAMSPDELARTEKHAATDDEELLTDEPPAP
jgi:transcriptional regulator with XRE-family HTH domain